MARSLLIVAGEISGDLHAAKVVRALKARGAEWELWGIGGDELRAEGVALLQDTRKMAVMGIVEVLKHYRFFKSVFKQVLDEVDRRKPEAALLVDYPGFNLRLAAELKKRGVKVYYYICPKVWAWNKKRIPKMAKIIDHLFVIFPFEVEVFSGSGLLVDFVGNPLVSQIDAFLSTPEQALPWKGARKVAVLPGSRQQEITRILPTMLAAARLLEEQDADLSFVIAAPNERVEGYVREQIHAAELKPGNVSVIRGHAREVMRQAEAGLVTSGTATLEAAIIGLPLLIVYKTSAFTYWFARHVITIRHIGLINIIFGRTVCPELIQHEATADSLAGGLVKLLGDTPERRTMRAEYGRLRELLGTKDAAENVASCLFGMDENDETKT